MVQGAEWWFVAGSAVAGRRWRVAAGVHLGGRIPTFSAVDELWACWLLGDKSLRGLECTFSEAPQAPTTIGSVKWRFRVESVSVVLPLTKSAGSEYSFSDHAE